MIIKSALMVLLALGAGGAMADEVTISALYRAGQATFQNTTPHAGFCTIWISFCTGNVFTVGLPIRYSKVTVNRADEARDRYFVQLPGTRVVEVSNEQGDHYQVTLEVTAVSAQLRSDVNYTANPVFTTSVQGGCRYVKTFGSTTTHWVRHLWAISTPSSPAGCSSSGDKGTAGQVIPSDINEFAMGYTLKTPSPFAMKPGLYRGRVDYTVGEAGDFNLGNGVSQLNSNTLTVNFELEVDHYFRVEFPAGSEAVVLEPPGGWQKWVSTGQAPPNMSRDLPFRLSATGPFKVHIRCQYQSGDRCAMTNGEVVVPFTTALTLPSSIQLNNASVQRLALPVGEANAFTFQSVSATVNHQARVYFEAGQAAVAQMMRTPGSTYRGDVTVVFDADI